MPDFSFAGLDLSNEAHSYIASCETLAQIAFLHCVSAEFLLVDSAFAQVFERQRWSREHL